MTAADQSSRHVLTVKEIINISRPHFWIYQFGTYLVGVAAAVSLADMTTISITAVPIVIFGFYFLFPANLFIYGINDIFDFETDQKNSKKDSYELRVYPKQHNFLWFIIGLANVPFILIAVLTGMRSVTLVWLGIFLFFAGFYSAPPIRAKSKPFIDSFFSSVLYVATGIFGFFLAGGTSVAWHLVFAGLFWAMAMHAYSAIPDIKADEASNINTVAVTLGKRNTLFVCAGLYTAAGIFGSFTVGVTSLILTIPYLLLMFVSANERYTERIFDVYTWFPYLNTTVGMILFFLALFR